LTGGRAASRKSADVYPLSVIIASEHRKDAMRTARNYGLRRQSVSVDAAFAVANPVRKPKDADRKDHG
jgi:hypothetical protein